MYQPIKFLILIAFCCTLVISRVPPTFDHQQACQIPIASKISWKTFWPLAFRLNGSLYPTEEIDSSDPEVWIPKNDELYLSCGPNYIEAYDRTEFIKVKCGEGGKFLTPDNLLKTAKDLKCDLRTIEEVIVEVPGCPAGAISGQYGYIHPLDKSVRVVGESCYNTVEGRTLFGHVRLGAIAEESLCKEVFDKQFFRQPHPSSTYKMDFMQASRLDQFMERLQADLGTDDDIPPYHMANFIDPNYLLPNKQLWATKKLVWNYFMLHDDVAINLEALKTDIANLGKISTIDVYVGSHGVTKLPKASGEKIPIYLNSVKKQFPIPELIWLVVKNGNKAAAFGVFNSPSTSNFAIQSPCKKNNCDQITWLKNVKAANLLSDNLVCCEYSDFRDYVKEVPRMADVTEFYN